MKQRHKRRTRCFWARVGALFCGAMADGAWWGFCVLSRRSAPKYDPTYPWGRP